MAGVRYRQQGRFDDAWAAAQEAAALLEGAGQPRSEGANFAIMGLLLGELGRAEESRHYNLRARAIFHAAGDRWSEGLAIANLAQLDQAAGDFELAAEGFARAPAPPTPRRARGRRRARPRGARGARGRRGSAALDRGPVVRRGGRRAPRPPRAAPRA